jgi:predicted patatin/cPLA2 family phospholipase
VLSDLRDPADTLSAVRASCAVPLLSGPPQRFRGEPLVDGGFVESVPYRSALREGGTHVLVLRSRDAGFRLPAYRRRTELALRLASPQLASLLRARPQRYNGEAEELEGLASHPAGRPPVTQVTVPPDRRLVAHLDTDVTQIQACIRLGVTAIASLLLEHGTEPLRAAA